MLIENHKSNDRCAPEEHNKKQEKSIIMLFLFSIATFGALMNNILPHPPSAAAGPGVIVVWFLRNWDLGGFINTYLPRRFSQKKSADLFNKNLKLYLIGYN